MTLPIDKIERGIPCPKCGSGNSFVKNSRPRRGKVYRLRQCYRCQNEFPTSETSQVIMGREGIEPAADPQRCPTCEKIRRMVTVR